MPVASPVQFVRVSYGDSSAVAVKLILSSAVRMRTRFRTLCLHGRMSERRIAEIQREPDFLKHVDQISIETHVSRAWVNSTEDLYYFGLIFALLEEAGLQLAWSSIFGCGHPFERQGCMPEIEAKWSIPCGYEPWPKKKRAVWGRSCHDWLFVRSPRRGSAHAQ